MKEFLRRQHAFLQRPLTWGARAAVLVAAVSLVAAAFLPLWRIRLVAPQYQEGLQLHIYSHKLVGGNGGQDLHEINGLNHYIGMKPLQAADFVEMKWVPFALGVFLLLALRAALIGRVISLIDLFTLFVYFGLFSLGSFYFRLYTYGHDLDPRAPVDMEPFTPVLIGEQQIANFVQSSWPQWGSVCLGLFPLLLLLGIWLSRKETP